LVKTNRFFVTSTYLFASKPLASGKVFAKEAVRSRCFITGIFACSKVAVSRRSSIPILRFFPRSLIISSAFG